MIRIAPCCDVVSLLPRLSHRTSCLATELSWTDRSVCFISPLFFNFLFMAQCNHDRNPLIPVSEASTDATHQFFRQIVIILHTFKDLRWSVRMTSSHSEQAQTRNWMQRDKRNYHTRNFRAHNMTRDSQYRANTPNEWSTDWQRWQESNGFSFLSKFILWSSIRTNKKKLRTKYSSHK